MTTYVATVSWLKNTVEMSVKQVGNLIWMGAERSRVEEVLELSSVKMTVKNMRRPRDKCAKREKETPKNRALRETYREREDLEKLPPHMNLW